MGILTYSQIASPISALSLLVVAGNIPAQPATAQGFNEPITCSNLGIHWTKAKSRGPVGRRDTLKAAMGRVDAGEAALGPCMTEQFTKQYGLESIAANSLNGYAPLIKEVRSNLTAVQSLPLAQQCRAATLFVEAWNAFHAKNPTVPILVHSAMTREHAIMCNTK